MELPAPRELESAWLYRAHWIHRLTWSREPERIPAFARFCTDLIRFAEREIARLYTQELEFYMSTQSTDLAISEPLTLSQKAEATIATGDLNPLSAEERVIWYKMRCRAMGLDWRSNPLQYLVLQGKLTLYLKAEGALQLASDRGISLEVIGKEVVEDLLIVTVRGTMRDGRTATAIGALSIEGLKGEAKAIAMMKAETKAQRRCIRSLTGFGASPEDGDEEAGDPPSGLSPAMEAQFTPASLDPMPSLIQAAPAAPKLTAKEAMTRFRDKAVRLSEIADFTGEQTARLAQQLLGYLPDKWTAEVWREATAQSDPAWEAALANIIVEYGLDRHPDEEESEEPELLQPVDSGTTVAAMSR